MNEASTPIWSRLYPIPQTLRERIIMCVAFGVFVGLFLFFFRPFGLAAIPSAAIKIAGYGLITFTVLFLCLILIPALAPGKFREEGWTVGKEILWTLIIVGSIGTANFLYTSRLGYFRLNLLSFLYFQFITLAVGVFPLTVMVLWRQNRSMKKYMAEARHLSQELHRTDREQVQDSPPDTGPDKVILRTDDGKTVLEFGLEEFLFAGAADNYVEIILESSGKISSQLVRITMAKLAGQLAPYGKFYRCHRSYIVNLDRVSDVRGNSQGLKLILEGIEKEIPVARAKSSEISDLLQK